MRIDNGVSADTLRHLFGEVILPFCQEVRSRNAMLPDAAASNIRTPQLRSSQCAIMLCVQFIPVKGHANAWGIGRDSHVILNDQRPRRVLVDWE